MVKELSIVRICLVTNEKLGESIRLEKQARTLLRSGHELIVVCWADKRELPQKFCDTIPIFGIVRPRSWLITKLLTQVYKLFYIDVLALPFILRAVDQFRPHVVLVRDFDLVGTVLAASRLCHFKVIYDVNDLVSYRMMSNLQVSQQSRLAQLRIKLNAPFTGIDRISRLESHYFRTVDRVTTPYDHYKEKMVAMGVATARIVVLPNYEDLAWRQTVIRDTAILERYKGQFVISYVGSFYPHRGVDVLIRAMPMVVEQVLEARLVLVGPVRDIETNLKLSLEDLVKHMGLWDYVEFSGTVPTKMVLSYVDAANVGVIPFRDTIHTNIIVGHKLFMYMAAGRPLIVTNLRGQAEVVRQTECGLVVPPDDPVRIAEAIVKLYHDPQLRHTLGEKGKTAVLQSYNWKVGSRGFRRMVDELAAEVK